MKDSDQIKLLQQENETLREMHSQAVVLGMRRVAELRGAHKGLQRMQRKRDLIVRENESLKTALELERDHNSPLRMELDQLRAAASARISMDEVNANPQEGLNASPGDWKQRVRSELIELDARIIRLKAFMQSPKIQDVDSKQVTLMLSQYLVMSAYSKILHERIALFYE